jgi:hypothetical protein
MHAGRTRFAGKDLEEMKDPNNDDDNGVNQKILVRTMLLTRLDLIGMASQVNPIGSLPPLFQAADESDPTEEMVAEVKMPKANDNHGDCR